MLNNLIRRHLRYRIVSNSNESNEENVQAPDDDFEERLRYYLSIFYGERQGQEINDNSSNANLMKDWDLNFRKYPLYINWKKLEKTKEGNYEIFVKYGCFGSSVYTSLKAKCPALSYKKFLLDFCLMVKDFILKQNKTEEDISLGKRLMENLPDLEVIFSLIKNKVILFREMAIFIIVLKIYEICYYGNEDGFVGVIKNRSDTLIAILKHLFILLNYLSSSEYEEIYAENFKGKIEEDCIKILAESKGRLYELPKTKKKFIEHIKYVYKAFKKTKKEDEKNGDKESNNNQNNTKFTFGSVCTI